MKQTPIEKAIEELYNLRDQYEYDPAEQIAVDKSIEKLRSLLPYEKKYIADIYGGIAIAFSNWRQEYVNELTHGFLIYTKGSEDTVVVNDVSDLYQYFITNVYNK